MSAHSCRPVESTGPGYRLGHSPALDGIRGLAVIVVVLVHTGCPLFPGGLHGVDLFFVLSGFLITSLLYEEYLNTSDISFRRFYARRGLRLLPGLFAFLACYTTYAVVIASNTRQHLADVAFVATYVSNWTFIAWKRPAIMGHMWSLAVEEHFYMLWPLAFLLIEKIGKSHRIRFLTVCGLALTLTTWRFLLAYGGASMPRLYLGTDTRGDFMLFGAAAAMACYSGFADRAARHPRAASVALGTALIAFGLITLYSKEDPAPRSYAIRATIVCLACTALVVLARVAPPGLSKMVLENRLIRWFGRISYALYLWHCTILVLILMRTNRWEYAMAFGVPVSIACAYLSTRFVEQPCLRLKSRFGAVSHSVTPRHDRVEVGLDGSSKTSALVAAQS